MHDIHPRGLVVSADPHPVSETAEAPRVAEAAHAIRTCARFTILVLAAVLAEGTRWAKVSLAVHIRLIAVFDSVVTGRKLADAVGADPADAVRGLDTVAPAFTGLAFGAAAIDIGLIAVRQAIVAGRIMSVAVGIGVGVGVGVPVGALAFGASSTTLVVAVDESVAIVVSGGAALTDSVPLVYVGLFRRASDEHARCHRSEKA